MLRLRFVRVHKDQVDRLRCWMGQLGERRQEVLESFVQEKVHHEQAYLLEGADGPVLVYAIELDDPEEARRAYASSTLPIDIEHRQQMKEIAEGPVDVELLYDVQA